LAEFIVRNSLNPYKAVKFGVTTRQVVPKENEGEALWVVEIATDEPTISGFVISPVYINLRTLDDLDKEIQNATAIISSQIDWAPLIEDSTPPFVVSASPGNGVVDIESSVEFLIKDNLPSSGLDLSSIKMTVNDFDVTSELELSGDGYEQKIKWKSYLRDYS
jgi:hypothetical protein